MNPISTSRNDTLFLSPLDLASLSPLLAIKDKETRKNQAIEYTYPQLLIQNPATRPGSILDRQGGSIFKRR